MHRIDANLQCHGHSEDTPSNGYEFHVHLPPPEFVIPHQVHTSYFKKERLRVYTNKRVMGQEKS